MANRSAYCCKVNVQPCSRPPRASARRLNAAISSRGATKNAASQISGGRYNNQNVVRRESMLHPPPPTPFPLSTDCGDGEGARGRLWSRFHFRPHRRPGIALFGGQVGREVCLFENRGIVNRKSLLECCVGDAVHDILIGVAVVKQIDHVVARSE